MGSSSVDACRTGCSKTSASVECNCVEPQHERVSPTATKVPICDRSMAHCASSVPDSFAAGSADPFNRRRGITGLLGNKSVLLFQDSESGSIKVDAAKCRARNFAIGPLRAVFVEYVEHHEFGSGRGLSGHF
jgi:hypothetical protein